jgi:hypothetical protein
MKAQSIFYIGELWDGGTCLDRPGGSGLDNPRLLPVTG